MGIPWFGVTHGINGVNYYLSPQIITWAQQIGCQYFRIQMSANIIWKNFGDPVSAWSWDQYDDAVSKILAANMVPIVTMRVWPAWALNNPLYGTDSEIYFAPDPDLINAGAVYFAQQLAHRYNGQQAVISNLAINYGPMRVPYIGYNEDYTVHHVAKNPIGTVTLAQPLVAGTPYTSIAIAASGIAANSFSAVALQNAAGQEFMQLSSGLAVNDTHINVSKLVPSFDLSQPFVPNLNYLGNETLSVQFRGIRHSPWSLFEAVTGTNTGSPGTGPEPTRDPQYVAGTIPAIYDTIKKAGGQQVGSPVLLWSQSVNQSPYPGSPSAYKAFTLGMNSTLNATDRGFYDWLDLHYYSEPADPMVGSNNTISFPQMLADVDNALFSGGHFTKHIPIWITEIGWGVPGVSQTQQNINYQNVLNYFKQYTIQTGKPNKFMFFTVDDGGAGQSPQSLQVWNGVGYTPAPAWFTVQSFVAANPSLLT